jgi:hypothetical protein
MRQFLNQLLGASHKNKLKGERQVKVVINNLDDFLSILQTKPSFCHLFARSQQAVPATVLISAVSVRIYQL